jgi:hypothetical protein
MFGSSLPPVVCRKAHVLITLFVFVCAQWCPTHIVFCFWSVFLLLVYPMLPISLDFPFLIAPSVFSNVYFIRFTIKICLSMWVLQYIFQSPWYSWNIAESGVKHQKSINQSIHISRNLQQYCWSICYKT